MVTPKSGQKQLQPFERDILFISIYSSCQHRTNAIQDATALTDTVLGKLSNYSDGAIIDRLQLKTTVLAVLKRFDTAAAVHYTAFHP
jgi:transcriptional regulator NrdR family protein